MEYYHVDNWEKLPELDRLHELKEFPDDLYARGKWNPQLFSHCAAVVGSRKITNYGKQVIESLVPQLVLQGKTIISGFMYGVDQYVHQVCLDSGGETIAVLGWGISLPLEGYDKQLADRIVKNGLLLSQWQDQQGALWTFPVRNRIVAALSQEVYVIEAAEKSGSLLTANLALDLHRPLFAVPGPITSRTSRGTNSLIAGGKASMWLGTESTHQSITHPHDPILNLLCREPLSSNEIARELHQSIAEVGAQLSLFTITNQITEREGKYFLNHAD